MSQDVYPDQLELTRREVLRFLSFGAAALVLGSACGDSNGEKIPDTIDNQSGLPIPTNEPQSTRRTGEFRPESTWSQDFSEMPDGTVDAALWRYELNPAVPGYNREAQGYTNHAKNVRIQDGALVIEAHREKYVYPQDPENRSYDITSGRIDTLNSLNFEYGKIEAKIKLPKGAGVWPAFWLLSANQPYTARLNPTDADWEQERFYMHDGEVDIMEAYGNLPGLVEATVHTFARSSEGRVQVPDGSQVFHTYGIEITPTKLVWTLDGQPYYTFKKPSDNPDKWPFGGGNKFYAILNLAMGSAGGDIGSGQSDWQMKIKSVKFYEYTGA